MTSCQSGDLEQLRATFPDWAFESMWVVVGTGPDQRRLHARKGDVTLSAWTADDLATQIVAEGIAAALREQDGES